MAHYQNTTIDYLEGRILPAEYESMIENDEGLYRWIQNMVPDGKQFSYCTPPSKELVFYPYDIRDVMKVHERLSYGGPKGTPSYHYHIHAAILHLFTVAFPNIQITADKRFSVMRELCLSAVPSYIGGSEVVQHNIIGKLLENIPVNLPISKQRQLAKVRIREAFHIEDNKYPRWIQAPEWPINNGKPMKYLKTVRVNSEFLQHFFVDDDTGDVKVVDDFN